MKLLQLLEGVAFQESPQDIQVSTITCNSRQVEQGALFVCIKGERADGHNHAAQAITNGAVAVLCQRDLGLDCQIVVEDTRLAYALACKNFFGKACDKLHLIGITGTNGKTTITYILKHILEQAGFKTGLIGTIHYEIGEMVLPAKHTTPDPLQLHSIFERMVKAGCTHVVMEVSSHALHQQRLVGCHFDCGVFTNLTQDHLDYHGTMENYFQAKKALFAMSDSAVLNIDDAYGRRLMQELEIPVKTFSIVQDKADFTAKNIKSSSKGSQFTFIGHDIIGRVVFSMPGDYSVANAMAAGTAALAAQVPVDPVIRGLNTCPGMCGRTELLPNTGDFTVIRDYAHGPDGLEKILITLRGFATKRIITLFGCAGERDRSKRPIMAEIVSRLSDMVILTSDNPRREDVMQIINDAKSGLLKHKTPYRIFEDRYEALVFALENCKKDDILLLAGKGHEDYQVLAYGTIYFDEKVLVQEILSRHSKSEI